MYRRALASTFVAAALLCGVLSIPAYALTWYEVTITVPPDTLPDDAHLIFQNTGGINKVQTKSDSILTISATGNQVDLTFYQKLQPGSQVTFNFTTESAALPVVFSSGTWTNGGVELGPISPNSVSGIGTKIPGMGTAGLILLSLLILGSAVYVLARRRTENA